MKKHHEIPKITNKTQQDIEELFKKIRQSDFSKDDQELLIGCVEFSKWMPEALQEKDISIGNLRRTLFGDSKNPKKKRAKKDRNDRDEQQDKDESDVAQDNSETTEAANSTSPSSSEDSNQNSNVIDIKSKGHGRLGHESYPDAEIVPVKVDQWQTGDDCPELCGGKLYGLNPGIVIRITGNSLATATQYQVERLRCALCGIVVRANLPEGISEKEKYDFKFKALLSLQKYFMGMPFYRQETFQMMISFRLPASTQFELCEDIANSAYPVISALEAEAANGKLVHQDDTRAKILSVIADNKNNPDKKRTGMFTTGIIGETSEGNKIALFYTGTQHAGEHLKYLLQKRIEKQKRIIQMCDALAANTPKELKTIISNCLAHGFRKFRDLLDYYPETCLHVLQELGKVYRFEEQTKGMTDEERLAYHRKHSKPVMLMLYWWLKRQLREKHVEPNSHLGRAIKYMLKNWKKLRRFLTTPGAPIDNNIVEAALKIPIRIRKNAMFYKTLHGASIASILTSLIYTAKLAGENPIDYLVALQENKSLVFKAPEDWVPWRFRETLEKLRLSKAA